MAIFNFFSISTKSFGYFTGGFGQFVVKATLNVDDILLPLPPRKIVVKVVVEQIHPHHREKHWRPAYSNHLKDGGKGKWNPLVRGHLLEYVVVESQVDIDYCSVDLANVIFVHREQMAELSVSHVVVFVVRPAEELAYLLVFQEEFGQGLRHLSILLIWATKPVQISVSIPSRK